MPRHRSPGFSIELCYGVVTGTGVTIPGQQADRLESDGCRSQSSAGRLAGTPICPLDPIPPPTTSRPIACPSTHAARTITAPDWTYLASGHYHLLILRPVTSYNQWLELASLERNVNGRCFVAGSGGCRRLPPPARPYEVIARSHQPYPAIRWPSSRYNRPYHGLSAIIHPRPASAQSLPRPAPPRQPTPINLYLLTC